ncbi:Shedu anti-phage system protein SduA domain-containing protein [Mycobacterium riyadhense]|uniref:Shedu anti-phage system protein SduA domain-containing protein n=1 Tax=Mycobacterium riyadhense TaxID=486698 RepID=UPI001EF9CDE1|nr:Shedu anti-phage system protein SduA domain-containing protein [Mycobacterium riyadhense]
MRNFFEDYTGPNTFRIEGNDFSNVEIRGTDNPRFFYFYDNASRQLIKDFVLHQTAQVITLCRVVLIFNNGEYSPRFRFWKRDKRELGNGSATEEISDAEVDARSVKASVDIGDGYGNFWRLIEFLQTCKDITVPHQIINFVTGDAARLSELFSGQPDALDSLFKAIADNSEAQSVIAARPSAAILSDIINLHRQREAINLLQATAEDPGKNEHDLQRILHNQWWMFGGRFIDIAKRRNFTVLESLDIPLLRHDGSLHIVELKQANIETLIKEDHGTPVLGAAVHDAVSQAMVYLRSLDNQRAEILASFGIDVQRASVTVVIGHPQFMSDRFTEGQLNEALRTYNSHLSRIEVMTYKELIDGARRSLDLAGD